MDHNGDRHNLSAAFLESMYRQYRDEPESVASDLREHFDRIDGRTPGDAGRIASQAASEESGRAEAAATSRAQTDDQALAHLQHCVDQLIRNYRVHGHRIAAINPLDAERPESPPELDWSYYGLEEADLSRPVSTRAVCGPDVQNVGELLDCLRQTYCRSIGAQFMHIEPLEIRQWLSDRMERDRNHVALSDQEQRRVLKRLTEAVVFERFIRKKYVGAKSFSLEGAESLLPLLDFALEAAGAQSIEHVVMAMTHRGRLNVLANVVGKPLSEIIREFEDVDPKLLRGRGDVKYHLGHRGAWETASGREIQLSLCFNPAHLESIAPVALGKVRAKQDRRGDEQGSRVMAVIIHGDAGLAGEGIVQETINLSGLRDYTTGGALHVVINNQIGFTTPPSEGRSSVYATDAAKMLQAPIFHVNGEDPEAVAQVVRLAMDFRKRFSRDVFVDMYCYRRWGHNEGDEPSFTQPQLYRAIEKRSPVRDTYLERLLRLNGLTKEDADAAAREHQAELESAMEHARRQPYAPPDRQREGIWAGYRGGPDDQVSDLDTGIEQQRLINLLAAVSKMPDDFHLHPRLQRVHEARQEMVRGERPVDWSAAEALAFASLATEGIRVRLTGQDSARGTFSQRHAVLHDYEDGHTYCPLRNLAEDQARVEICNSPLSEAAVLGFEYGYSHDSPDSLVMWEAQFGDFANNAQAIIDQFITSGEEKWLQLSGIVLLLPHGMEGQGPEHASARLERWLTLAANDNIQIINPTTPAQYFHALRRQVLRPLRKPLIVLTPKSLLRHRKVVSGLDAMAAGGFRRVIPDEPMRDGRKLDRVLLCTGKIYYELQARRDELERDDVAIVRLEQLYPLPTEPLRRALAGMPDGTSVCWVQEEPENMGAWPYLAANLRPRLFGRLPLSSVTRPESASPATGSRASHELEQAALIDEAFGGR